MYILGEWPEQTYEILSRNGRINLIFVVPTPSQLKVVQRYEGKSTKATRSFIERIDQYTLELTPDNLESHYKSLHADKSMDGTKTQKIERMWELETENYPEVELDEAEGGDECE